MRVVHQLISYFREHGALSERQLEQLRLSGFLPEGDEDASRPGRGRSRSPDDEPGSDRSPDIDRDGQPVASIGPQKRRKPLGIDPLCRKLADLNTGWDHELRSLDEIANRIADAGSWPDWVRIIRTTGRERLRSVIEAVLISHAVTLHSLSASLDLRSYREIMVQGSQRTQALSAYRALLRTYDFNSLGRYAWVLKYEPVNNIFNLIQAKRAILGALNDIFDNRQQGLTAGLRGNAQTNLFWAFVILRSAKAEDPWLESRGKSARSVTYLDKLWPPRTVLQRAALYALFMAPDAVLSFLTSDFDVPEDARGNPPWIIPPAWTSPAEKHYIKFRD